MKNIKDITHRQIILLSFIATIIIAKLFVYCLILANALLTVEPHYHNFRLHHISWGLVIILVTGYIAIGYDVQRLRTQRILAAAYGVGAGLIIDEFWFWLTVQSHYFGTYEQVYFNFSSYIPILLVGLLFFYLTLSNKK